MPDDYEIERLETIKVLAGRNSAMAVLAEHLPHATSADGLICSCGHLARHMPIVNEMHPEGPLPNLLAFRHYAFALHQHDMLTKDGLIFAGGSWHPRQQPETD